jgi:hypothetical protein
MPAFYNADQCGRVKNPAELPFSSRHLSWMAAIIIFGRRHPGSAVCLLAKCFARVVGRMQSKLF